MKKLYEAYVATYMVDSFEKALCERKDKVKVVNTRYVMSESGEPLVRYILEAEEGIINPKWEIKH